MHPIRILGLLVLFFSLSLFTGTAQHATPLQGRVYSNDGDVAGTHVVNQDTQRATIADANGFFTITVKLNDTLVFSAVQFKRKVLVVTEEDLKTKLLFVPLEDMVTELDEVVVMPYNLSGDLSKDMKNLTIEPVVTASTLGLPNAYVKVLTQNRRKLAEADAGKFIALGFDSITFDPIFYININKILNRITGRTQQIKRHIVEDERIALLNKVRGFFPDSVLLQELKISKNDLNTFMYFCEADSTFKLIAATDDRLKIWEFFQEKSKAYHAQNNLD